jgi:hypothetical protein
MDQSDNEIKNCRNNLANACFHLSMSDDVRAKVMYVISDMMVTYIDSILLNGKDGGK